MRGRPLENVELLCPLCHLGHDLDGRGTRTNDRNTLVLQLREFAVALAAGVFVVPATRVKRMPLELVDAGDGGQLREALATAGKHQVRRRQAVAAIGLDQPAPFLLQPPRCRYDGLEARLVVETMETPDLLAELEHFIPVGVTMSGGMARLLEQRHVDMRLDIAHRAGVTVPVPRSAEIAGFVDDANIGDAHLMQARAHQQAAESSSGNDDLRMAHHWRPVEIGSRPGISSELRELAVGRRGVLSLTFTDQALVALPLVLLLQHLRIELEFADDLFQGAIACTHSPVLDLSTAMSRRSKRRTRYRDRRGAVVSTSLRHTSASITNVMR